MGVIWSQMFPPPPPLTEKNLPSQAGKVFIVTGGASWVGLELCRILYYAGARVYLAGRSEANAQKAIDSIVSQQPQTAATSVDGGELLFLSLELDDLSTIRETVKAFRARESKLDVLWNNAGTGPVLNATPTAQGYDVHLATNCLGPFLLTQLLLPALEAAGHSRVVWTSSMLVDSGAPNGGFDLAELDVTKPKDPTARYTLTKVANVFLAAEMARRIDPQTTGILSVSQNPGNLMTAVYRHQPQWLVTMLRPVLYEPRFGAYTELWTGLGSEVNEKHNGQMVLPWGRWHPKPRPDIVQAMQTKEAGGDGKAQAVWDWCEAQTAQYR